MPFTLACTNEQKVTVTVTPESAGGKPAVIDGALRVSVQSGSGTVEQDDATPLSFTAVSGDTVGDTVYLVVADAMLGAEEVLIQDIVTLTVTSAAATQFGFSAGAPVTK